MEVLIPLSSHAYNLGLDHTLHKQHLGACEDLMTQLALFCQHLRCAMLEQGSQACTWTQRWTA